MKFKNKCLIIISTLLILCGCSKQIDSNDKISKATDDITSTQGDKTMELLIKGQSYKVNLYDNSTVNQLLERLPMTLSMDDLHQNEKYHYLNKSLPTNSESIGTIEAGDLMLFGSDCIVLFYETFTTSYQYTRIGHLENIDRLKEILGNKSVEITFQIGQ